MLVTFEEAYLKELYENGKTSEEAPLSAKYCQAIQGQNQLLAEGFFKRITLSHQILAF